jgi:DNA-binding response OmpR family regulator
VKRVLIVDDERDVADALRELLEDTYAVTVAYDGLQALRILEGEGVDLVVLDLMMPAMSGESVLAELRSRGSTVPVLFTSAASDLKERAHRSHANDFIAKPFGIAALEKKVAQLLAVE